nr:hypothetical protein [Chthoniobacterales bacterium]
VPLAELRLKPEYPALIRACEEWELKSVLNEVREEAAKAGTATQSELLL